MNAKRKENGYRAEKKIVVYLWNVWQQRNPLLVA